MPPTGWPPTGLPFVLSSLVGRKLRQRRKQSVNLSTLPPNTEPACNLCRPGWTTIHQMVAIVLSLSHCMSSNLDKGMRGRIESGLLGTPAATQGNRGGGCQARGLVRSVAGPSMARRVRLAGLVGHRYGSLGFARTPSLRASLMPQLVGGEAKARRRGAERWRWVAHLPCGLFGSLE
jgi:hypothetical protein